MLDEALKGMDQKKIERFVTEQGCEWTFNPPHASHFGGAWERQIGTIRRVLDAMFAELLVTLMAIVNQGPRRGWGWGAEAPPLFSQRQKE